VATSGTSFGEGHITILRRLLMDDSQFRGEVIFTFDGDKAGQRAALRAFSLEEKFVTQTFVAVQPDGLDPCDLRLSGGDTAIRDLVARRVPLFEFAIRSALDEHNMETPEGRLAALDAAAPIVAKIKDTGLRQLYAVSLDRWLGMMNEEFVLDRIRRHSGPPGRPGRGGRRDAPAGRDQRPGSPGRGSPHGGPHPGGQHPGEKGLAPESSEPPAERYDLRDPVIQVEREALKLAVQRPALCGPVFDELGKTAFTATPHAVVYELIAGCGGTSAVTVGGREWAAQLRGAAPDDQVRTFVTQLAVDPPRAPRADGEPDARYADAVLARIGELSVSRDIAAVKSRLQRVNPVTDTSDYNRLFGDLVALEQRRKVLGDHAGGAL